MKNNCYKKSIILVIIVLFIGAVIIPTISGNTEKDDIVISGIDDGLIGYWSFDEGTGYSVQDDSGNGNDGTIYGASWTTSSVLGNALNFDGVDDLIEFSSPVLNIPPYTICAWVKPDSTSGDYRYILSNGGGANLGYGFFMQLTNNGEYQFGGKRPDANHGSRRYPASSTDWTFICGSWDGIELTNIKLYINGEFVSGTFKTDVDTHANPFDLRIGSSHENMYSFNGDIDEVRIYNRVLGDNEIKALYNNPSGLKNTLIFGKIDNLDTGGNFIIFEAEKLRCIQFSPFQVLQFSSGERIRISEEYFGIVTLNFAFGFFKANI